MTDRAGELATQMRPSTTIPPTRWNLLSHEYVELGLVEFQCQIQSAS